VSFRRPKGGYAVVLSIVKGKPPCGVPPGDTTDPTREPGLYDETWGYLRELGIETV
jgi:hypothetical protein